MNYEESLAQLKAKEKKLFDEESYERSDFFDGGKIKRFWNSSRAEEEWKAIKSLVEDYSQSRAGDITNDKIEEAFGEIHGFTKQKEELKSFLLLRKYFQNNNVKTAERGKILCLVGPPGVGKTLFAKQYAKACSRGFFKINVGGMSDPQIIQGVDKSYVNSHVGKIIQAIQETKSCDPVILIDEVEKTGKTQKGSLKDALLHILDNEQNESFTDAYLNVSLDISKITFILTANDLEKIPGPLKSRLEVVKLKGYNESQKIAIGKLIIKKVFKEDYSDFKKDLFEIKEEAFRTLITKTPEEGARQLELNLRSVIRRCFSSWAQQQEKGQTETKIIIDTNKINEWLAEDLPPKEDSEEEKLRRKIAELEKENEKLKNQKTTPIINFQLSKLLMISQNKEKEHCATHKKLTLSTSEGTCSLCKLTEQTQQIETIITKENWKTCQKKWQAQKNEWLQTGNKLQNGTEEEQELSNIIKSSVDKIEKRFQQVQKASNDTNSQSNQWTKNLPWLIGGGLILTLFGYYLGWLFTNEPKKKKKTT